MHIIFKIKKGKEIHIDSDSTQYTVFNGFNITKDKDGKESKSKINPAYFSQFGFAVQSLIERGIKESDANTLEDLYADIVKINRFIEDKLTYKGE